jgi:hypothetical protein
MLSDGALKQFHKYIAMADRGTPHGAEAARAASFKLMYEHWINPIMLRHSIHDNSCPDDSKTVREPSLAYVQRFIPMLMQLRYLKQDRRQGKLSPLQQEMLDKLEAGSK